MIKKKSKFRIITYVTLNFQSMMIIHFIRLLVLLYATNEL